MKMEVQIQMGQQWFQTEVEFPNLEMAALHFTTVMDEGDSLSIRQDDGSIIVIAGEMMKTAFVYLYPPDSDDDN